VARLEISFYFYRSSYLHAGGHGDFHGPASHYGDSLLDFSRRARRAAVVQRRRQAIVVGLEKHGLGPIDAPGDMVGKSARSCNLPS
jgi:hypothetical protein